jgi:acetoin utilization deacetylase AcuC-like enzyme
VIALVAGLDIASIGLILDAIMSKLPIVFANRYDLDLDRSHRFPAAKFRRIGELLVEEGLADQDGFHRPGPAPVNWIAAAHDRAYVDQVVNAAVPDSIARDIGYTMTEAVAMRSRTATSGTIMTARLALERGLASNAAGGSHHARRAQGAGFCVFNDVAVAIKVLQAEGATERVLIVDLDVHQGDGTADIFADDPNVFTFSMHGERNYPQRKIPGDLDIPLSDHTGDDAYLAVLKDALPGVIANHRPDLVFFNAGVDPHVDDRLGRLSLSNAGLLARNRLVIDCVRSAGLPLATVLGGGYSDDIEALSRRHLGIFQVAAEFV